MRPSETVSLSIKIKCRMFRSQLAFKFIKRRFNFQNSMFKRLKGIDLKRKTFTFKNQINYLFLDVELAQQGACQPIITAPRLAELLQRFKANVPPPPVIFPSS